MVSSSRSAGLRPHRAHAASQPRARQRCLTCSMSFLCLPLGGHHQLLLVLPVTKRSEGTSLPSATMTTIESQWSGESSIWVLAENITIPEWAAVRRGKAPSPSEKVPPSWRPKTRNLQPAMSG